MIVSVRRLRDYMSGIGLNTTQTQAAEDVLAGVQAELERYLRRPLELRTVTEPAIYSPHGWIDTSVTPVVSTTSPGFYVANGLLRPRWAAPIVLGQPDLVTYVGGYDGTAPELADVRLAIMRVAAREMEVRHDEARTVKELNTTRTQSEPVRRHGSDGWTPDELAQFDRLRERVVR